MEGPYFTSGLEVKNCRLMSSKIDQNVLKLIDMSSRGQELSINVPYEGF